MAQLVIIGTIHQSTKNYTALNLYNALDQIHPEVIFAELPPEPLKDQKNLVIPFGEELMGQEGSAIKWYLDRYNVPIIPIDLPNRNKIYADSVSEVSYKKAFMLLNNLLSSTKLNVKENTNLSLYFETVEKQRKLAGTGSIVDINSNVMDQLVVTKHKLASDTCTPLLDKYSNDMTFADSWRSYEKWFEERETYMTNQIISWCKDFTCAVVPVGADHRAGLHQKLINYSRLY